MTTERFLKPTDKQVCDMALLMQTEGGTKPVDIAVLTETIALANIIIDRLYENGDITKPASKE